jgi:hypothetical protein
VQERSQLLVPLSHLLTSVRTSDNIPRFFDRNHKEACKSLVGGLVAYEV